MWTETLANQKIKVLSPYEPGKPIDELKRELGLERIIKLASNEHPMGASVKALAAAQEAVNEAHRYPDGAGYILKKAISERYGVPINQITLGNGSNDVLELLMRVFVNQNDSVMYAEYAFAVYGLVTQAIGAVGLEVPAIAYGHDLNAMQRAIAPNTKMVIIANPNNPTGTWLSHEALIEFLKQVPKQVLVVIDEAYVEYPSDTGYQSLIGEVAHFENLIVTRTFSKAYGLAGLRVGFMVAHPEITDWVNRVRQPFNVNSIAQVAAAHALTDEAHVVAGVKLTREGMEQMVSAFKDWGIAYIPSVANFVAIETKAPAREVFQALLKEGVITRPLDGYSMPHHLRISIGLPEENAYFLKALERVLK